MRKALIIATILVVLAVAALAVFILTFDINRYKAALASQLESVTGNPVEIGALALSWKGQVVMEIDGFKIYDRQTRETLLSFEAANAAVQLMPLLQKRFDISSISLTRPTLHIIRTKDGRIEVLGYTPKPKPAAEEGPAARAVKQAAVSGPALVLDIAAFDIRQGTLRFQDMMIDPPSDVTVQSADISVKNISLTRPASFDAAMALAGKAQNISASGTAGGFAIHRPYVKDFNGRFDLGTIGYDELMKAVPQLRAAGVREGVKGVLTLKVRDLAFADNKVSKLSADAIFADGRLALAQLRSPLENMDLTASVEGDTMTVKSFSGTLANAGMKGSGRIDGISSAPRTTLRTVMEIRGLKAFLATIAASDQTIDGNLNITFDGTAAGSAWEEISRTLAGTGTLTLDRGVIVDSNMVRQALGSLTLFPGLGDAVQAAAPELRQSMSQNYTLLKPFSQSYRVEGSYIILPELYIATDFFDLRGTAKVSFTGDLSGSGIIRFSPQISGRMIAILPQMQYLADGQGLVQFPIAFKGGAGGFKVIPDMNYIAQKVAIQTAQDALVDLLTKSSGKKEGAEAAPAGQTKAPKIKDLLKSLMKKE